MSGLLVTAPSAQRTLTVQADQTAAKLLPGAATGRRSFTSSDVLALYAEIYENNSSGPPRRVDVTTRLIDETGAMCPSLATFSSEALPRVTTSRPRS